MRLYVLGLTRVRSRLGQTLSSVGEGGAAVAQSWGRGAENSGHRESSRKLLKGCLLACREGTKTQTN